MIRDQYRYIATKAIVPPGNSYNITKSRFQDIQHTDSPLQHQKSPFPLTAMAPKPAKSSQIPPQTMNKSFLSRQIDQERRDNRSDFIRFPPKVLIPSKFPHQQEKERSRPQNPRRGRAGTSRYRYRSDRGIVLGFIGGVGSSDPRRLQRCNLGNWVGTERWRRCRAWEVS